MQRNKSSQIFLLSIVFYCADVVEGFGAAHFRLLSIPCLIEKCCGARQNCLRIVPTLKMSIIKPLHEHFMSRQSFQKNTRVEEPSLCALVVSHRLFGLDSSRTLNGSKRRE